MDESSLCCSVREIAADETVSLRQAILWPNQPLSHVRLAEDDAPNAHHFGAFFGDEGPIIAVISLFLDEPPPGQSPMNVSYARFRKFACAHEHQGRGLGSALLAHVVEFSDSTTRRTVWCDARLETAAWYEKRGMQRSGEIFWKGVGDEKVEYVRMKTLEGSSARRVG